jgi:hypothetical protein
VDILLVDMLNYGAAAQTQFGYRTDDFANKNLTEAQKAMATGPVACSNNQVAGTNYIGSNLSGKFKTPCLATSLVLEPSYAIDSVNEDNSFYLVLSGFGSSSDKNGYRVAKSIKGKASGTQGCGCMAYGHKSPTRKAGINGPLSEVSDIVATHGTWTMKWKRRVLHR